MNEKNNIINYYKLKIKELKLHNEYYYNNDNNYEIGNESTRSFLVHC